MNTESAPEMFSSKRNHERRQWPLQYICQTCCGAVTEMERVGEEVATPAEQGDSHRLVFLASCSTFSSLVQFFVTRHYMS